MNERVDDAMADADHEYLHALIASMLSDIKCKVKPAPQDPAQDTTLGEARTDLVSVISSRAADYLTDPKLQDMPRRSRLLVAIKLVGDISHAIPMAQPEGGYTQAHLDVAKQLIPALIHHNQYHDYLNAYALLCDDVYSSLELKNPIMLSPALAHSTIEIDNAAEHRLEEVDALEAAQRDNYHPDPLPETRMRLDRMLEHVKANRDRLFQAGPKDTTYHNPDQVAQKMATLEALKESLIKQAATELQGTDAFGEDKLYSKAHQWQIPPTGYADMFLTAINLATDPHTTPEEFAAMNRDGSPERKQLLKDAIRSAKEERDTDGYIPHSIPLKYTTAMLGMHPDEVEAARNYARTFTTKVEMHPDPQPNPEEAERDSQHTYYLGSSLFNAILRIPAGESHQRIGGTKSRGPVPPATFGTMAQKSERLNHAINHFTSSVLTMLHESPLKEMHVSAGGVACAKIITDLTYAAQGLTHPKVKPPHKTAPKPSLVSPSQIIEFLDEIAENIANPKDAYGAYIRAYAKLCGDIKDPLMLDGHLLIPEETAYLTPEGNPIDNPAYSATNVPQDETAGIHGDLSKRQKDALLVADHHIDGKSVLPQPMHMQRGESKPDQSMWDAEYQNPILIRPRVELSRRLDLLINDVRKQAPALFNVPPDSITPDSVVGQKLALLDQFKQSIFKESEREVKGTTRDAKGRFASRKNLFDPYWSITVEGYCNMFMHGLERACSNVKPDKLATQLQEGSPQRQRMRDVEASAINSLRAEPDYEPAVSMCNVKSRGTLFQDRFKSEEDPALPKAATRH